MVRQLFCLTQNLLLIITSKQLGIDKVRLELEDTKKFDNLLHDKIQELEIELEDSNIDKEIVVNQIDTLQCVLNHLLNLKYGENVRTIKIVEANNLQQVKQQT